MAINPPRIAGDPAQPRRKITSQQVETNGSSLSAAPAYEGQISIKINLAGNGGREREADIYVAVDIQGTLTWTSVSTGIFINAYTGLEWDEFYLF